MPAPSVWRLSNQKRRRNCIARQVRLDRQRELDRRYKKGGFPSLSREQDNEEKDQRRLAGPRKPDHVRDAVERDRPRLLELRSIRRQDGKNRVAIERAQSSNVFARLRGPWLQRPSAVRRLSDLPASGRTRFAHFHGAFYRFRDPTRISLARRGEDRPPSPVPIKVYDETIRVMRRKAGRVV